MCKSSNTLCVVSFVFGMALSSSTALAENEVSEDVLSDDVILAQNSNQYSEAEVKAFVDAAAKAAAEAETTAAAARTAKAALDKAVAAFAKAEANAKAAEIEANVTAAAADAAMAGTNAGTQPKASQSDQVELRSADGLVAMKGTLVSYENGLIRIKTSQGTVGVEDIEIECIGIGCPTELMASQ